MTLTAALMRHAHGVAVPPVSWAVDHARALNGQWASYTAAAKARFSEVHNPAGQTGYWLKTDIVDGDAAYPSADFTVDPLTTGNPFGGPFGERAEAGHSNPGAFTSRLFNRGDDLWITWKTLVPSAFPDSAGTWYIVTQFKQIGGMGTPAICLKIGRAGLGSVPDAWELWTSDSTINEDRDSRKGRWALTRDIAARFVMHVKFHTDPTIGFINLFGDLDGNGLVELLARTNLITMKDPDGSAGETVSRSHTRVGHYRDPAIPGNGTIYYLGPCAATSRTMADASLATLAAA